ncbi:ABC transporter substrate-binding protein [Paenibacillus tarimensis]|uniref:ABC transporter substrate-binding protein n=1 Tax=Paenibacillus tarimensis TaxID=416012 RepID=UPI001F319516|nr:extracellular solute-binding protein [Paenibacillus tarimensis]MCF2943608.1 extracellular solute-binding protein [Paenibacillus tarimensis]
MRRILIMRWAAGLFLLLACGCSSDLYRGERVTPESLNGAAEPVQEIQNQELHVWSFYDPGPYSDNFMASRPGIKVKTRIFSHSEAADAYLQAMADGTAPDVMIIDDSMLGSFNTLGALENLNTPNFGEQFIKERIPDNYHSRYQMLGSDEWIALPLELPVAVTFYRYDLFKEAGLPYEPEELGEYLEDPGNWLEAARILAEKDIYLFQHDREPADITGWGNGYVSDRLLFARTGREFEAAIKLCRQLADQGLSLNLSIWDENGQEALRSGRLAMVYLGTWGVGSLEQWAPETKGKWRVTKLPMNLYGSTGGAVALIPERSNNKVLAWEYIGGISSAGQPSSWVNRHPMLDGQDIDHVTAEAIANMKPQTISPFDKAISERWGSFLKDAAESNRPVKDMLVELEQSINAQFAYQRKVILETALDGK